MFLNNQKEKQMKNKRDKIQTLLDLMGIVIQIKKRVESEVSIIKVANELYEEDERAKNTAKFFSALTRIDKNIKIATEQDFKDSEKGTKEIIDETETVLFLSLTNCFINIVNPLFEEEEIDELIKLFNDAKSSKEKLKRLLFFGNSKQIINETVSLSDEYANNPALQKLTSLWSEIILKFRKRAEEIIDEKMDEVIEKEKMLPKIMEDPAKPVVN